MYKNIAILSLARSHDELTIIEINLSLSYGTILCRSSDRFVVRRVLVTADRV